MKGSRQRKKAALVVHALYNTEKQTKEKEKETWIGKGSVGKMDRD